MRRLRTLRTVAEGVAPINGPMKSAPYGPQLVDPSLFRHIPLFSASVLVGEKTPENVLGIGMPKVAKVPRRGRHQSTEIHRTTRGAAHRAGLRGTRERQAAGHDKGTRTGSKQNRLPACRKPSRRTQDATNHGTEEGARQHGNHTQQTPASNGGVQAERAHEHTDPKNTARNGEGQHKTKLKHTATTHTPARTDGVQVERARKHTDPTTPSPEWRGAGKT